MSDLLDNQILIISVFTWAVTQILKVIVILIQERRLAWNYFITSGGMPSSHTSTVCALATAIALTEGMSSVYFAIAVILASIVMYDAAGVRQDVGHQSAIINRIVQELRSKATLTDIRHELREIVGHTPSQVFVGAVLGIFIAWSWIAIVRM